MRGGGPVEDWWNKFKDDVKKPEAWAHEFTDPNSYARQAVQAGKSIIGAGRGRKAHHRLHGGDHGHEAAAEWMKKQTKKMRGGGRVEDWWNKFKDDIKKPEAWAHEITDPNSYARQAVRAGKSIIGAGRGRKAAHLQKGSAAARAHMAHLRSLRRR